MSWVSTAYWIWASCASGRGRLQEGRAIPNHWILNGSYVLGWSGVVVDAVVVLVVGALTGRGERLVGCGLRAGVAGGGGAAEV